MNHLCWISLTCWSGGWLAGRWSGSRVSSSGLWLLYRSCTICARDFRLGAGGAGGLLLSPKNGLELVHGVECCNMDVSDKCSFDVDGLRYGARGKKDQDLRIPGMLNTGVGK